MKILITLSQEQTDFPFKKHNIPGEQSFEQTNNVRDPKFGFKLYTKSYYLAINRAHYVNLQGQLAILKGLLKFLIYFCAILSVSNGVLHKYCKKPKILFPEIKCCQIV